MLIHCVVLASLHCLLTPGSFVGSGFYRVAQQFPFALWIHSYTRPQLDVLSGTPSGMDPLAHVKTAVGISAL